VIDSAALHSLPKETAESNKARPFFDLSEVIHYGFLLFPNASAYRKQSIKCSFALHIKVKQ
jgi:hypothetical protein